MKDERLKKLHDLLKGLLYTYNTKNYNLTAIINDIGYLCSTIIFNESFNENWIARDELLWCNETWKKYDCDKIDFEKIDWDKWDLTNGELKTGNGILFSVWKTTGAYPNKDDDYGYVNTFVIYSDGERIDSAWGFDEYSGKTLYRINYYPTGDDGDFTLWYVDGSIREEGKYKNQERDRLWISYKPNGTILYLEYFVNGNKCIVKESKLNDKKQSLIKSHTFILPTKDLVKVIVSDDGKSIKDIKKL